MRSLSAAKLARAARACDPAQVTELNALRRAAEELAKSRKERPSTGHLLALLCDSPGPEQALLRERRLGRDILLQAARISEDDDAHKISEALSRARQFAGRTPKNAGMPASRSISQDAAGLHLLFALCQEPKCAAYRMLAQLGVDISKLRTHSMQIALGLAQPPRLQAAPQAQLAPARRGLGATVAMPLLPPQAALKSPVVAAPVVSKVAEKTQVSRVEAAPVQGAKGKAKKREARKGAAVLARFARSWSDGVRRGELSRPLGREREVARALDALGKLAGNNPCFVGSAGVGKTSAALCVACELVAMGPYDVWVLSAQQLLARCARAELATRLHAMEAELLEPHDGRTVLILDDLPAFFAPEAGEELAAFARRALAQHKLPCLSTAESAALAQLCAREPQLSRQVQSIELDELGRDEALQIVESRRTLLQAHHEIELPREALARAVSMTERYLPSGALPERALHVVDMAAARARRLGARALSAELLAEVVSELSQVPCERVLESDQTRLLQLEQLVGERLVGHEHAVGRIAQVLRRNATGMGGARPIGVFLLLGPTGVGKTETAKAVAECMFHSEHAMTRLDLSEFSEPHAVARLIGAPPGYVGHEAGGQLTSAVRKRPHQVVLLDEIEKAHPEVLQAFLAVFDEGRMTDGRGVTVSFENTVIFLTSNLGVAQASAQPSGRIGFGVARRPAEERAPIDEAQLLEAARAGLPPELWNRFDDVLVFSPLSRAMVRDITAKMLAKLSARLTERHDIALQVAPEALEWLLDQGAYDARYGARPVRRTLARLVEAELAERVLRGELRRGDRVLIACSARGLTFTPQRASAALAC